MEPWLKPEQRSQHHPRIWENEYTFGSITTVKIKVEMSAKVKQRDTKHTAKRVCVHFAQPSANASRVWLSKEKERKDQRDFPLKV